MLWVRGLVAVVAGLSAAVLAFGMIYVRGDGAGVISFLRARAAWRELRQTAPNSAALAEATTALQQQAAALANVDWALRLWPLELLFGALVGWLVWQWFGGQQQRLKQPRLDLEERMLLRQIYRLGRSFEAKELEAHGLVAPERLPSVLERLVSRGTLVQENGRYHLSS